MALKGFSFTSLTKYIRDLVAGVVAFTAVKCNGDISSGGDINLKGGKVISRNKSNLVELTGYTYAFMTADKGGSYVCTNAFWDGAVWHKFDNNRVSNIISVKESGNASDGLVLYHSPAGESTPTQHPYKVYHQGNMQPWLPAEDNRSVNPSTSGISYNNGIKPFFITANGIPNVPNGINCDALLFDTWGDGTGGNTNMLIFSKNGSGAVYGATEVWNRPGWSKGYQFYTTDFRPTTENTGVNDKDYPVGTILLCANAGGARNQEVGVINDGDSAYAADPTYLNHAQRLSGTWRVHGRMFYDGGNWKNCGLVQRVA